MKKNTLLYKLVRSVLIISLIPLGLFSVISLFSIRAYTDHQNSDYCGKINTMAANATDEFSNRLLNLCYFVNQEPVIHSLKMMQTQTPVEQLRTAYSFKSSISQQMVYEHLSEYIRDFTVLDNNGTVLFNYSRMYGVGEETAPAVHTDTYSPYFTTDPWNSKVSPEDAFAMVKRFSCNEPAPFDHIFVIVDLYPDRLTNIFQVFMEDTNSAFMVHDGEKIVSKSDSWLSEEILTPAVCSLQKNDYKQIRLEDQSYLVTRYQPDASILSVYTLSTVRSEEKILLLWIYGISLVISVTLAITLAVSTNRNIILPIRVLKNTIEKATETSSLNVEIPVLGDNEIGDLANCFRGLMAKINSLINENYKICIQQKNAQIKALQSQINPHFLYNTLETISSIALCHDLPQISEISQCMSRMYRYNAKNARKIVTIEDELQHLENYLTIIKIRFENKINFEVEVDEQARTMPCLRFVLQPIVENAVMHAFRGSSSDNTIWISVKCLAEKNEITVRDNGCGIQPVVLNTIEEYLQRENEFTEHIGLINVNVRLRAVFGEQYGIRIESGSHGTTVRIALPKTNPD